MGTDSGPAPIAVAASLPDGEELPARETRAGLRGPSPAWLALALVPCAVFLAGELYVLDGRLGLPLDDSWIHLQFARNLAGGAGLAYNPGQRVVGSTAPLWTALLSVGFLLGVAPLVWAKALGVGFHLLGIGGTWRLGRELGLPGRGAILAAVLAATSSPLVWGALSGMEVSLFTALAVWGMALHVRDRRLGGRLPLGMVALTVASLARPEGLLLLALAVVDRLLSLRREDAELRWIPPDWRSLIAGLALALLVIVPAVLAYQTLGGSPLPTTFDSKAGYSAPGLPRARYLFEVVGVLAAAQPLATLLAPAGILVLLARLGARDDRGLLPALWATGLPLAYGILSGGGRGIFGNFGRYFFPLLPALAVLAVVALGPLDRSLPPRLRIGGASLARRGWLGAVLLLPGLLALPAAAGRYVHNLHDIEAGDVALARWLQPRLPPEATLAVDDIGALKYLLPNPVLDLAGIVSPRIHDYARRSRATTGSFCPGALEFVREERPDYLAIFPRHHPCFTDAEFPPLLRLDVPGNITLGEGTIVLHATPWTRAPLREPQPPASPEGDGGRAGT
jgi:hypothetical protein